MIEKVPLLVKKPKPKAKKPRAAITILDCMRDRNLFGRSFRGDSWEAWKSFLAALFALPMTEEQLTIFRECTQRETPPEDGTNEAWLVCGRRSGKSRIMALCAVYLAVFHDWSEFLASGERGTLMVIAGDRKQARSIMRFCLGLLKCPMLRPLVEREQRGEIIDLTNRISIEIHTCSFRSVRGYTCVAALLDKLAFWPMEESTCPDTEVIAAIKPSMATVPGAMLICASSPYGRRGALWDNYRQHFGKADSNKLVASAHQGNELYHQQRLD